MKQPGRPSIRMNHDDDDGVVPQGHPATTEAVALFDARQRREWDDANGLDFGSLLPAHASVAIYDPQPRRFPGWRPLLGLLSWRHPNKPQR
jgi:hypothetical protein